MGELTGVMVRVWRNRDHWYELLEAVEHNCGGKLEGEPKCTCPAHQMLEDQNVLDHLAYAKLRAEKYVAAEWHPTDRAA